MAYQDEDGAKSKINEAIKFWRLVNDSDSTNRAEALNDIKFAAGDQWPVEIQNSRNLESRPCLTMPTNCKNHMAVLSDQPKSNTAWTGLVAS